MTIDLSGIEKIVNPIYYPLFKNTSRYLVLYGGAGSGKSKFAGQKVLVQCLLQKHKILVVRKVANTLRNSCFSMLCSYIYEWGLEGIFKINKSEMTMTCFNGSVILFKGIDDPEKIKSIDGITGIWIEEASELSLEDFTQLDLRLRGITEVSKQIILSFNPVSAEHWLKKRFFECEAEAKDTSILKTTYLDNRFLDEKYKEVLEGLKETNPAYYKVYCLGEWGVLDGLVYEKYKVVDEMPKDLQLLVYGVDFGFNHPSAVVLVGFNFDELYIKEVFYKTGFTSAKMIEHLKHNHNYITKLTGYFETAEPDKLQEFREAGFMVQPAKKSIIDGINAVKKYRLNITRDSVNLLRELANYTWAKDKEGKSLDMPIDDYNHALDALRYAVYSTPKPTAPQSYLESYAKVEGAW